MSEFTEQYVDMLITQYRDKPNASGEIAAYASTYEVLRDVVQEILESYDVDTATGDMLNKIGATVGIGRVSPILNDDEIYRFFIKVKIAKNTADSVLFSDDGNGIQNVIQFAFDGEAYVVDKLNMTLDIYVSENIDLEIVKLLFKYNLLPRPQGVNYANIKQISLDFAFGFDDDPYALALDDKFDASYNDESGEFLDKIIILEL